MKLHKSWMPTAIVVSVLIVVFPTLACAHLSSSSTGVEFITKIDIINHDLPDDPFIPSSDATASGILTYSYMRQFKPYQVAIVVHRFGSQPKVTTYIFHVSNSSAGIFGLKRSADGRYVAFKYGNYSGFQIYVFDVLKKIVIPVEKKWVPNNDFLWSPDGHFLAFIEGTLGWGGYPTLEPPLSLIIWDATTHKQHSVISNNFIANSFSWSFPHTLYFSMPEVLDGKVKEKPKLYQFSLETGKTKLLLPDCYRPIFSPDGKQVACFGSEDVTHPFPLTPHWEYSANYMALSVVTMSNHKRTILNVENGEYPKIVWLTEDRSLLSLKQTQRQTTENSNFVYSITHWDTSTGHKKVLFELQAHDFKPYPENYGYQAFTFLSASPKGNKLAILGSEILGENENKDSVTLKVKETIQIVDLLTKTKQPLGNCQKALDYDWKFIE